MRRLPDSAVVFEVADDDSDGLRGQICDPREIGAREAGLGAEHRQRDELRRGHAEAGQRPLHRQPRRRLGLP
jgi:hypothetical protein